MMYALVASLAAWTRPALASRQNRWIGEVSSSARAPEFWNSNPIASIDRCVARTWSRLTR